MIDEKIAASMTEGEIYYLIKQVDDWWEITTLPGASFFIKSECAEIVGPNPRLMTRDPKSIRREFRFPSQKRIESTESDIDVRTQFSHQSNFLRHRIDHAQFIY